MNSTSYHRTLSGRSLSLHLTTTLIPQSETSSQKSTTTPVLSSAGLPSFESILRAFQAERVLLSQLDPTRERLASLLRRSPTSRRNWCITSALTGLYFGSTMKALASESFHGCTKPPCKPISLRSFAYQMLANSSAGTLLLLAALLTSFASKTCTEPHWRSLSK